MPINYKIYPRNWYTDIVPAIIKRSGNCCENCGVENGIVITRHVDGSWSTPGAKDWTMIYDRIKTTGCTLAKSMKYFHFFKITLTTHHFDQDKTNHNYHPENKNDPANNLFFWCQRCHQLHDRNIVNAKRKYGRKWQGNQLTLKFENDETN